MNSQPIFRDARGRAIISKTKKTKIFDSMFVKKLSMLLAVFALSSIAAVTQIDLAHQAKGVLPVANGGTGSSSAQIPCSIVPAFSGDWSNSAGSCTDTVAKVNGTSVPTNSAADQLLGTTASATGGWVTLPNCGDTSHALAYNTTTHVFSCQAVSGANFSDNEVPSGTIDGSNAAFVMAHTPSPAASLSCYKNGQLMIAGGADYTLATATATFVSGSKPQTGDALVCSYRF